MSVYIFNIIFAFIYCTTFNLNILAVHSICELTINTGDIDSSIPSIVESCAAAAGKNGSLFNIYICTVHSMCAYMVYYINYIIILLLCSTH